MAQPAPSPAYEPLASPVSIVGPQFVAQYPVDLTIVSKVLSLSDGNFAVTDVNGNIIFKVKGKLVSLHDRRVLLDSGDTPILSFQKKLVSAHRRWLVFRGESSDAKDLLFKAKQSSIIQFKTSLDVFLASNEKEEVCDFKVKGSWHERSCTIYAGDSPTILAQMNKKHTVKSVVLGKETFSVTVYPNVDYAFIVALVVILDEINDDKDD